MIMVTGGAGFIGSNLVKALNDCGREDILIADNLSSPQKEQNLADLKFVDYLDKHELFELITTGAANYAPGLDALTAVFHQGACSDTMEIDEEYILQNNFVYSRELLHFCASRNAQYIYASSASVYGSGRVFAEQPENEAALNAYARSKLMFDNYIRGQQNIRIQCAGLRYFNVYGPREQHKGRMASVAWHFYHQYQETGRVKLFSATHGYGCGEQLRDFVFIDDVVNVNLFLLKNPQISGIFNVGTGHCQSFNAVALAVINCCRQNQHRQTIHLDRAVANGEIIYIPVPDTLIDRYQSYTQADLSKLNAAGYHGKFDDVACGVSKYIARLTSE